MPHPILAVSDTELFVFGFDNDSTAQTCSVFTFSSSRFCSVAHKWATLSAFLSVLAAAGPFATTLPSPSPSRCLVVVSANLTISGNVFRRFSYIVADGLLLSDLEISRLFVVGGSSSMRGRPGEPRLIIFDVEKRVWAVSSIDRGWPSVSRVGQLIRFVVVFV